MSLPATLTSTVVQLDSPRRRWMARLTTAENWALTVVMVMLVVLPLAEALLRRTLQTGIPGSTVFEQHLTLVIGMLGGAIAARENRLLELSTLMNLLKGRTRLWSEIFCAGVAAAVTAMLAAASFQFLIAEREAGSLITRAVPAWWIQLVLPAGFILVALRIVWHAGSHAGGRIVAAALAVLACIAAVWPPVSPDRLVLPGFLALGIASLLGIPAFATMGGAALLLFWGAQQPVASIAIDHYSLVINPSLPTLPLFTLAGYFLAEGGTARRMVRLFRAVFGQFSGGSAIVTALVCAMFTSFTGASGVTIIALGGLLMPVLLQERYSERNALGLVTGAGSLGLLFAPCLPLILYAIVAKIPIENMFLGGILPGTIMLLATIAWGLWVRPKTKLEAHPFDGSEALRALWDAKWDLLLPVVAFVALFSGWATPVEAAAITVYAMGSQFFIYRDLGVRRDLPRVMTEGGLLVGGVLLILGIALGLTNYLVDIQLPARAAEWTTHTIHSPLAFLLALNLFLLVVGCLMDIYSAIVIQVPLLAPIAQAYGLDPVHVGIIFLANLELGYLTPPVGLNLFMSSYRFKKPLGEVLLAVWPVVLVLMCGVLLITYVPWLTTALPAAFGR